MQGFIKTIADSMQYISTNLIYVDIITYSYHNFNYDLICVSKMSPV